MIIRKYGVTLQRIRPEHLELVREKRNSEAIRRHMFHQEIISVEQQVKWYESINNRSHYYFVMYYRGDAIGLINGKNLDYDKGESEGGIFIWDERYWNSFVPVIATVMMADMTFNTLGFNRTFAEVRSDNGQQASYNKMLGYTLEESNEETGWQRFVLTKENYLSVGARIRAAVHKIGKDSTPVDWSDVDFSGVSQAERKRLYSNHPPALQALFDQRFAHQFRD